MAEDVFFEVPIAGEDYAMADVYITSNTHNRVGIVHDDKVVDHLLGIDENTLVIFDVDKVLVYAAEQVAANDDCFSHIMGYHMQSLEKMDARAKTLKTHNFISTHTTFSLVDPEFKDVFAHLKERNIDFFALTARDKIMSSATIKHIKDVELEFPIIHDGRMDLECRPNAYFEEQIIFADAGHKGECLFEFLGKINYTLPNKVIFIDDKEKNLHQVREFCEERNIDFYGVRYSKLDEWTTNLIGTTCFTQANNFLKALMIDINTLDTVS